MLAVTLTPRSDFSLPVSPPVLLQVVVAIATQLPPSSRCGVVVGLPRDRAGRMRCRRSSGCDPVRPERADVRSFTCMVSPGRPAGFGTRATIVISNGEQGSKVP